MLNYRLCPLCLFPAKKIKDDDYRTCCRCGAIFLDKKLHLSPEAEKQRYETHNNDVNNSGYREFVSPITSAVFLEQAPDSAGLDFGSGNGPVISAILKEKGYCISQYDPFFADDKELLEKKYDYVVCCEVVEHFRDPRKEFPVLKKLLKPGGLLYIMTDFYKKDNDFKNWYYRNDATHVFIYSEKTFKYVHKKFGFKSLNISDRLVVLKI